MGPHTTEVGTLYAYDIKTNEPVWKMENAKLSMITEPVSNKESPWVLNRNKEVSLSISLTRKKLSRKRFIKLMMGSGFPRNAANELAAITLRNNMTYFDMYKAYLWMMYLG